LSDTLARFDEYGGTMAGTGKLGMVATVLALAAAVALLATLLAMRPADAASRYKIVTKTFSNAQPITMPLSGIATPYPSEKNVGGFKRGRIRDVNLTLKNLYHTFPDDVNVMISYRGVNRTVMSDVGGDNVANNITLTLNDEAALPLRDESELTSGTFQPTNVESPDTFPAPAPTPSGLAKLSGFDGKNPNGPWVLWVVDDNSPDGGQFASGWSITIRARVLR
jgi:hypothetical protein